MDVVPDSVRLDFVSCQAVSWMDCELQHGWLASGRAHDLFVRLYVQEIDLWQYVPFYCYGKMSRGKTVLAPRGRWLARA